MKKWVNKLNKRNYEEKFVKEKKEERKETEKERRRGWR